MNPEQHLFNTGIPLLDVALSLTAFVVMVGGGAAGFAAARGVLDQDSW